MDVSLDDYISKANFKVKIGNPSFKGNNPGKVQTGSFQHGKRAGAGSVPALTDVHITVPSERKLGGNINKTNQVRDARDKLVAKNKFRDARDKLNQKAQSTDARQKLITIRSRQSPGSGGSQGPVDARAKIEAKKQGVAGQGPGQGNFSLTRTVANSNTGGGNIQMTSGPQGRMQITKTLTKVMPPGYEAIVGPTMPSQPAQQTNSRTNVKLRLGPKQGSVPSKNIVNITRTISSNTEGGSPQIYNLPPQDIQQYPFKGGPPVQQPYPHPGGAAPLPYPTAAPIQQYRPQETPPQTHPYYPGEPPYQHQTPPTQPPYPIYPQPGQYPPQQAPPPPISHQAPPTQYTAPTSPPYPVEDNIPVLRSVQQQIPQHGVQPGPLPVIHVKNDQYRQPEPQHTYPPYGAPVQHAYPPQQPQYQYAQSVPPPAPQQPVYYAAHPQDSGLHRTVPNTGPASNTFVKTVVNDGQQPQQSSSLKRKSTDGASGPLRLSSTNTVPVLASTSGAQATRQPGTSGENPYKYTRPVEPASKKVKEEDESDVISPLQGYKIIISNLHVSVTQDDVIELFGAIGAIKKVKLVKPGTAEVLYVKREEAVQAAKTYHERELDGQPMIVKMVTPVSARVKDAPEKLPTSVKPVASGPLKLSKKPAGMGKVSDKEGVDVGVLHKALFKSGSTTTTKPVTFTVNI